MTNPSVPSGAAEAAALFEAAGLGTWSWDRARDEAVWSPLQERLHGLPSGGYRGTFEAFLALVHPEDRERVGEAVRGALASGRNHDVEYRTVWPEDGSTRWLRGWGRVTTGADGEPTGLIGVGMDVTERKAAEAERGRLLADVAAERSLLEATLEHLPVGVVIADAATGRVALANARMDLLLGADPTALPALLDASGAPLPPAANPLRRAVAEGETVAGVEVGLRRPDGTTATLLVKAAPIRGADGTTVAGVATFDDVSERQRADARRAFLAEASEFLAASLGDDSTLQSLAGAAVPTLADLCIIDLVEDGPVRTAALVGRRAPAVRALDAVFPPGRSGGNPMVVGALRSGEVQWEPELDDAALARVATGPEHLALLRDLGPTAAVCVPLRARGRVLGAVTLMMAESGRRLDGEDRRLAEEFARRVAIAVDNARLFAGEQAARRQAEATTERMARLQRLTAELASATTLDAVAAIILDRGVSALGAKAGMLALADPDRGSLRVHRAVGYADDLVERWHEFPIDAPVALAEAVRTGQPVYLASATAIAARYPDLGDTIATTGTAAMAAIPIVSAGQVLAAIGLSFAEPQPFDPEARALVDSVAHQSALALERVRLLEAERTARTQAEAARGRLAFLAEASATLGSSLDYQATMRQLAGLLTPRLADWATIHLVTPAGRVELLELVHGDPAEADLAARLDAYYRAIPLPATVGSVLATGEAVVVPEITPEMLAAGGHDPEHLELLMGIGMTSAMVVPLAAHDEALGAITLVRAGSSPPYSAEDLAFVTDLASRAAVAIANARHFLAEEAARREAEAATRRTVRLQAITAALSGALTQDAVVTLLIEQGSAALGARGGTVAVADGPDGFRIVQSTDFPDDVIARWRRFTADAGIAIAEAIRTGEPVLLPTEAAIEGRFPHLAASRARVGYRAYAAIPLLADRRAVGAIGLTFAEPRAFAAEDVALMLALARQSAQALERARLYEAERAARDQAEAAERRGRREAARLVALANLSRAFVEAEPDYATAVDAVARITADHTGDCCVVRLVSDDGHWADVVALHHPDPATEARFREIATPRQTADEGFSGIVLESGAPLLVPDVAAAPAAPRFPPDYGRHLAEIGLRGMLVVPLRARGRHLGTLALLRDRPQPPLTADDANFTQELADRAALAIDNARLYQEARAAIRARDEFLSVAAHELRTPVTTVKGYAQMLLRSQKRAISPERTLQFLSAIDDATDRLKQLAEDLLDVSRLRLGQLPLRRRETDLVALAAAVVERFSAQLDDHHSVRLHVAEAPAAVWADPDRVDQILSNLIDNAAKYSPAGGEIAVGVGPDGDGVRLTVRDRGIGLPPGEAETIFEPFNRATNAARENLPGLGLGLSICRSLAERHGGRIWAESAGEGEGTTFVLWLPRKEPGDEVIGS